MFVARGLQDRFRLLDGEGGGRVASIRTNRTAANIPASARRKSFREIDSPGLSERVERMGTP